MFRSVTQELQVLARSANWMVTVSQSEKPAHALRHARCINVLTLCADTSKQPHMHNCLSGFDITHSRAPDLNPSLNLNLNVTLKPSMRPYFVASEV